MFEMNLKNMDKMLSYSRHTLTPDEHFVIQKNVYLAQAADQCKQYIAKVLGAVGGSSESSANRPHKVQ